MYERFTDRARRVMQLTNQEAQRFNHEYIEPEDILTGILKEGSGVACTVLKNLGAPPFEELITTIRAARKAEPDCVLMGKLPQTAEAKKVIEYAIEGAKELGHNYVGSDHLLLGLCGDMNPNACGITKGVAEVMLLCSTYREKVVEEIKKIVAPEGEKGTPAKEVFAAIRRRAQERADEYLFNASYVTTGGMHCLPVFSMPVDGRVVAVTTTRSLDDKGFERTKVVIETEQDRIPSTNSLALSQFGAALDAACRQAKVVGEHALIPKNVWEFLQSVWEQVSLPPSHPAAPGQ